MWNYSSKGLILCEKLVSLAKLSKIESFDKVECK